MNPVFLRAVHGATTLYMMLILLRWFASHLSLDLFDKRYRWIAALTDPLVNRVRRVLPPMGPFDFGPIASVFLVWLVRVILVGG